MVSKKVNQLAYVLQDCAGTEIINYVPCENGADLELTLRSIRKWSEINDGHHNEKRAHTRYHYRGQFVIAFLARKKYQAYKDQKLVCIEVEGKDISQGGAGFLCHEDLIPIEHYPSKQNMLRFSKILTIEDRLAMGIRDEDETWTWINCRAVRMRKTIGGFNEVGLSFVEKITSTTKKLLERKIVQEA